MKSNLESRSATLIALAAGFALSGSALAQQAPATAAPQAAPAEDPWSATVDPRVQQRKYLFKDTNEQLPYALFVSSRAAIAADAPPGAPGADALAAARMPVLIIQGDMDTAVPVAGTRRYVERLKELGAVYEYIEIAGLDHNIAGIDDMYKFFAKYSKPDQAREISTAPLRMGPAGYSVRHTSNDAATR